MSCFDINTYRNESHTHYLNYLLDMLYTKGIDIVDLLTHNLCQYDKLNNRIFSKDHIIQKHLKLDEMDIVKDSLKSGQSQAVFAYSYGKSMTWEELKDLIYTALFEKAEIISRSIAYDTHPLKETIPCKMGETIGYGINQNLDFVKTDELAMKLCLSNDPISQIGIELRTVYPLISRQDEIIKPHETIIQEYDISEKQFSNFKRKSYRIEATKEFKKDQHENFELNNTIMKAFSNR